MVPDNRCGSSLLSLPRQRTAGVVVRRVTKSSREIHSVGSYCMLRAHQYLEGEYVSGCGSLPGSAEARSARTFARVESIDSTKLLRRCLQTLWLGLCVYVRVCRYFRNSSAPRARSHACPSRRGNPPPPSPPPPPPPLATTTPACSPPTHRAFSRPRPIPQSSLSPSQSAPSRRNQQIPARCRHLPILLARLSLARWPAQKLKIKT